MSHHDLEWEAIPGLPGQLPDGERVLWQGRPRWRPFAARVFHLPFLGMYLALLVAFQVASGVVDGAPAGDVVLAGLGALGMAAGALGLFALLGFLHARGTIYTITSRRVAMRGGVVLPLTFNLPFSRIGAADVAVRGKGDGDIVLHLAGKDRLAYLALWPHARPWRFAPAQPMLRALAEPEKVAQILGDAVQAWNGERKVKEPDAAPPAPVLQPQLVA